MRPAEPFDCKYSRRGPDECWPWIRAKDRSGYGSHTYNGRAVTATRYMWELVHGSSPGKMFVLHSCDNRACVNPRHLSLGTLQQNKREEVERGRHARGERNGMSRLTAQDVDCIRKCFATGAFSKNRLATAFGVSGVLVGHVVRRKAWRHV